MSNKTESIDLIMFGWVSTDQFRPILLADQLWKKNLFAVNLRQNFST